MRYSQEFLEQVKGLQNERSHRGIFVVALALTGLALLLVGPLPVQSPWYYFAAWPLIGLLQYQIVIAGHEAVHRTFCPSERLNEAVGALTQALVGVNFTAYRIQHTDHHGSADPAQDPDGYIYSAVIGARRGAPRLFSWTFGTFYELAVKIRQKGAGGIGNLKNHSLEVVRMKRRHTFYVLMAQGLLFLWCFFATHHLYGYFILWFGPLFTVAVFLNRTRIVVEHGLAQLRHRRVPFAIAHKLPTIDIETNFLDRLFFSPFSFNYHSTHHLFPSIPFFNLKKASRLCELHNVEGHLCLRQTYLKSVSTILAD